MRKSASMLGLLRLGLTIEQAKASITKRDARDQDATASSLAQLDHSAATLLTSDPGVMLTGTPCSAHGTPGWDARIWNWSGSPSIANIKCLWQPSWSINCNLARLRVWV